MLLELVINDGPALRASQNGKGWLSAHLNITMGTKEDSSTISLTSIDTSSEPNQVHSTWEAGKLSVGDKVEIRLLADGQADPPTKVHRTSESPRNLFSNVELARRLLSVIKTFDADLWAVIEGAEAVESKEEFDRISRAIGSIAYEVDQHLITPTFRRHPELLQEAEFKGMWK